MAVNLTISGLDPHGGGDQHTVPDGATIAVRRTHDGFLSIVVKPPQTVPVAQEETASNASERAKYYDRALADAAKPIDGRDFQKSDPTPDNLKVLWRLRETPDFVAAVAREINILRERQEAELKQVFSEVMRTKHLAMQYARQEAARATDEGIKALLKTGLTISLDLATDVAAKDAHG